MGKEVEMHDAEGAAQGKGGDRKGEEAKADKQPKAAPPPEPLVVLRANVALIEKAVAQKEARTLFGRVLRQTAAVRKRLAGADLAAFLEGALPQGAPAQQLLLAAVKQVGDAVAMEEADGAPAASEEPAGAAKEAGVALPPPSSLPEVEVYAYLLVTMFLLDRRQYKQARDVAAAAVERLGAFNRRTLDVLGARIYSYLSLAHERTGSLPAIRSVLLGLHRTAVLRHDDCGAETLLNLLLRNYLEASLVDQAERLRAKAQRPEASSRSMQQQCRYLFYLGRIRAVQLEYSEAKDCLQQAARKAPASAVCFRVAVAKWLVLVRLLLGEVPERSEFTAPDVAYTLAPYFDVTQAVRGGDLAAFSRVAAQHDAVFRADRTHNLIVRLRHNVIRAGLRRISLAYSRISLADVAAKLGLPSVQDTESIVAKTIRDGGIEGELDHEAGVLRAPRPADIYATDEPQAAFHARIAFCMDVHNEAVKAMRYGEGGGGAAKEFEDATALRERQEQELQAALEEDDDF